jgi:predicted dehydrogenase
MAGAAGQDARRIPGVVGYDMREMSLYFGVGSETTELSIEEIPGKFEERKSLMNRRYFFQAAALAGVTRQAAAQSPLSANDKIGVAFIGLGNRGSALLKETLSVDQAEIRVLCDLKSDRIAAGKQAVASGGRPDPAAVTDWRSILDRKDVQAVVSALPVNLHARNYLDVIAAGKDLYAEKPLGLTPRECDAVVAAANKSRQIVQVGFQRRADPRVVETVRLVQAGELGQVIEGRILWSIGATWGPRLGDFGKRAISGDWMVEQAVHNWDVVNWALRSKPAMAYGIGNDKLFRDLQPDRDVHDYYSGIVQYENGVIVNILHSWIAGTKFHDEYTRLAGTRGMVDFNTGVISYHHLQKKADREAYPGGANINNTLLGLQAFFNSVRTRRPPVATVEHGRDAVLACLLVRDAVYGRRTVKMAEILR